MQMLCYKCGRSWNYKGKNTAGTGYITCPGCLYKIRVDKALTGPIPNQKLLTNKKPLLIKLPNKLPTTNEIKPLQIREPVLIDLQEEEIKEAPRLYPGFKIYTDQFGEKVGMREVKSNLNVRQIPY